MSSTAGLQGTLIESRLADVPPWRRWYVQNERLVYGLAGFVSVLVVWELAVRVGWLKAAFISSPTRIVAAAQTEIAQGRIWGDIGVSLLEFSLGFVAATIVGVLI